MRLRTEYTFRITEKNGRVQNCTYTKKVAEEKALKAKAWYEARGGKVEFFKIQYNGWAFVNAEKIW